MPQITLKILRNKGDETAESVLHNHMVQQNSCTRTAYQYSKKNDLHLSATEMINSKSVIQTLISQRPNISGLNYWLKQAALHRAAELISANDELKKDDETEKPKLEKQLEKFTKKKDKYIGQFEKLKNSLKTARELLAQKATPKKIEALKYKIGSNLKKLSQKQYSQAIKSLDKEISKIKQKLEKIENREKRNYTSIFGTRDLFLKRCAQQISKEEFRAGRLAPLWSLGDKEHGNRLFNITMDGVIYKPIREEKYFFPFCKDRMIKTQIKELECLIKCLGEKLCPVDVKIDDEYIYINAEVELLYKDQIKKYKPISYRFASVDANPEYYGFAITDWFSSGKYEIKFTNTFILKQLFDEWFELNKNGDIPSDDPRRLHILEKIDFETKQIAIRMAETCEHYKVNTISVENLNIKSEDIGNHVSNAKCINLWKRNLFFETLEKQCVERGIRFLKVAPDYSSFIGNFIFRQHLLEPDMNIAALEIGRRAFEFTTQYITKTRPIKKNVVFPETTLFRNSIDISMEEIGLENTKFSNWKSMFIKITKSGTMYRRTIEKL